MTDEVAWWPEGEAFSFEKLNPDGTLIASSWHVNTGPGRWTMHGEQTGAVSIVGVIEVVGSRLRDGEPVLVNLVWPIEQTDQLIERLTHARNVGMMLRDLEGGADGPLHPPADQ